MPLFAIVAYDRPDAGTLRADTRPRHLDHVGAIAGPIATAGAMLDESGRPIGSVIVADFTDLEAAQAFAAADPFMQVGLFGNATVSAFRQAFP